MKQQRVHHVLVHRFIGFSGVGAVGTVAHYLLLVTLVQVAGTDPVIASIAGFVLGACINYVLSYYFVFRSAKRHIEAGTKFFMIAIVGASLNGILMKVAIHELGFHYLAGQVLATLLVLMWNFMANQLWTFKG